MSNILQDWGKAVSRFLGFDIMSRINSYAAYPDNEIVTDGRYVAYSNDEIVADGFKRLRDDIWDGINRGKISPAEASAQFTRMAEILVERKSEEAFCNASDYYQWAALAARETPEAGATAEAWQRHLRKASFPLGEKIKRASEVAYLASFSKTLKSDKFNVANSLAVGAARLWEEYVVQATNLEQANACKGVYCDVRIGKFRDQDALFQSPLFQAAKRVTTALQTDPVVGRVARGYADVLTTGEQGGFVSSGDASDGFRAARELYEDPGVFSNDPRFRQDPLANLKERIFKAGEASHLAYFSQVRQSDGSVVTNPFAAEAARVWRELVAQTTPVEQVKACRFVFGRETGFNSQEVNGTLERPIFQAAREVVTTLRTDPVVGPVAQACIDVLTKFGQGDFAWWGEFHSALRDVDKLVPKETVEPPKPKGHGATGYAAPVPKWG